MRVQRGKTDDLLQKNDVSNTLELLTYAQQRIGTPIPIGVKKRGAQIARIKDEMEVQRWNLEHLVAAVDYMKSRGIKARSFDYVLYHVEPAIRDGFMPRVNTSTFDSLEAAVADAVFIETDDAWTRKLCLARGVALQMVYGQWREERLPYLTP
jgi:hypothetical protein